MKTAIDMETEECLRILGASGEPYEFNVMHLDVSDNRFMDNFPKGYTAVFLFTHNHPLGSSKHKFVYCGKTTDISTLEPDSAVIKDSIAAGANCLCYYYETSECVRDEIVKDITDANSLLVK